MGRFRMTTQSNKHGFTLVELVLSLGILTMLAALVVPLFGNDEAFQIDIAKRLLVSDLEYAQILAITNTDEEIALVVNESGNGWHIANLENPATPLDDSVSGNPIQTKLGFGAAASAPSVKVETNSMENMVMFDQNGGLADFTQNIELSLIMNDAITVVRISPTTGSIQVE